MKTVASVAEVLDETKRKPLMTDEHISPFRAFRKGYRVTVEI